MAEPFLAEIRLMSFSFAPKGWALCNGQLLPINQNQALFSLLGTSFGGDGRVNFALPDYRARTPMHVGGWHTLGERGGAAAHTLSVAELPEHTHVVRASTRTEAGSTSPESRYLGRGNNVYTDGSPSTTLRPDTVTNVGGAQAHLNLQPFLTLSFCIALQGIFPSPT
ncbi:MULTISPECIES: phage tail protein [unclassified Nocardioides]|uniref:phage tail protein n=1 Tax=unclassified Nocardioides TaxID=2615069 RepID=UPI0036183B84